MNTSLRHWTLLFLFPVLTVACNSHDSTADAGSNNLIDVAHINSRNDSMVIEARGLIRSGDLLLRTGTDFSSEQVRDLSKEDKSYSHGGIAVIDSGRVFVYHVEPDYYYVKDKVRKEPLDSFVNRAHNKGFAVARFDLDTTETKLFLDYLDEQYHKGVSFDMAFDLKTDDKMYCSEMIKKGLAKATNNRIEIETQLLSDKSKFKIIKQYFKLPEKQIAHTVIIPIDRLYLNKSCTVIKRFVYLQ